MKDRVHASQAGRVRCVGTSATLGSGDDALPRLVQFGEAIFGEEFADSSPIRLGRMSCNP